ncbi:MAG: FAD-binding oxidoreductase [Woeseiaceae bacterium]|nr:FAD-binding oxidoreductase [Woeseiaceae bacterium]
MNADQQQEHTGSYYAATANERTNYPRLAGAVSADVCVVGAGFTGVSAALTLAERGYSVAVVEANRVGWGASGRNGGQVINGFAGHDKMAKKYGAGVEETLEAIRWRGHELIRDRVSKYSIDCDLKDGFAEVALKARQFRILEEYFEEREKAGFPHRYELWDRDKTCEMFGTDFYHGAFVCYRDGHVHPLNLCLGEARAARGLGVQIFEQSPVTHIEHGARPRVVTANGYIEADSVILAGNAYSKLEPKHLKNLVFPASSYIIATEPLPVELAQEINRDDVAVCDVNEVVDYWRLSADKRMLYGGACNYSGQEPRSIESYIRPRMLEVYPQLADVKIEFEWSGKIGIVLNRTLTVGRTGKNVYYCQGYSGHGVSASHVMGEILADAVTGTMERFDLFAGLKHIRTPGPRWLGNQLVALGMLFYRLKDKL